LSGGAGGARGILQVLTLLALCGGARLIVVRSALQCGDARFGQSTTVESGAATDNVVRALCGSTCFRVRATVPGRRRAVVAGLVRGVYRSGAADDGDCRGGGSRDSGVVGSCGGTVRSLFSVSCGSSWRQLVSLLKWRRALRVSSFHGLV